MAFVPPMEVEAYFKQYCDYTRNLYDGNCDPIIDYFEDTYIGRSRRNAPRRAPLFAQPIWNMFHRISAQVLSSYCWGRRSFLLGIYGETNIRARPASCQPSSSSSWPFSTTIATTVLRCKSKVNSNLG